jgi:outer membrane protein OmpA-like peptidoglycan-associated protein
MRQAWMRHVWMRHVWLPPVVFMFVLASTLTVMAAPDCAPLGRMPTYEPGFDRPETRDYAAEPFKVKQGEDESLVTVEGRKCTQSYTPKDGTNALSDREIQRNYRDQIQKLGATITFTDGNNTFAKLIKDGQETWLKVYSQENEIDVLVLAKRPHKQTLLPPSGPDYRLVGHMPNYTADTPEKKNFDGYQFKIKDGDDERVVTIEGTKYLVGYNLKNGAVANSDLDIQTNYRNALAALNAEILFTDGNDTFARLENNGQSIWLHVYSQENGIQVAAIEEKPLQLSIQPPEASALKTALDKEGRIALYVNFDFAKATLKGDAAPVIAQIVKLLKDNPSLKIEIDGHTDNVGGHDYNVKLSQDRAAAVVAAIVAQGIAKERLTSGGFGPDKPVADNANPEGRAKNRRVELVKS